jgi:ketosteroid isomerase-like protein
MTVEGSTAECDRVAVEAESHANLKNGKLYHNHYHFLMLFRAGKIAEVHEHNDSAHVAEIFGKPAE